MNNLMILKNGNFKSHQQHCHLSSILSWLMKKKVIFFLKKTLFTSLITERSGIKKIFLILTVSIIILSPLNSSAKTLYKANEAPSPLKDIKVKEQLGKTIELDLVFKDENSQSQSLKKYFKTEPVLMSIVYYNCPSLCNFHLNGLFEGLEKLSAKKAPSYQLVIISMDSRETPSLAKTKKQNYLNKFKGLEGKNIHFLTGSKNSIKTLAESLGFAFYWDKETSQFAHSPVAYVLSPKAIIARYLYGVEFEVKTLNLSLLSAGMGKITNIMDRILLFCYRFNPKENKYTIYASNIMKAGEF